MKLTSSFRFATEVWLTSLFLSPVMVAIFLILDEGGAYDPKEIIGVIFFMVLIGGILSIPNWLLLTVGVKYINRLAWPMKKKRIAIQALAMALTIALFYLVMGDLNLKSFLFPVGIYLATLTFGIWILRLEEEDTLPVRTQYSSPYQKDLV